MKTMLSCKTGNIIFIKRQQRTLPKLLPQELRGGGGKRNAQVLCP